MKPGDLVKLRETWRSTGDKWNLWKDRSGRFMGMVEPPAEVSGELHPGDLAVVIAVIGKEVQVLNCKGEIGWMWKLVLREVEG